jgi:putative redox protein
MIGDEFMPDSWREVVTDWQGGLVFIGSNAAGGMVQISSFDDKPGLTPMELLLAGLAGCTGSDVVSILEKKHKALERLEIKVRGKRAEEHPKVYTEIHVQYLLWGEDLDPISVNQAIQLSSKKYCSASAMLGCVAKIDFSYEINKSTEISE